MSDVDVYEHHSYEYQGDSQQDHHGPPPPAAITDAPNFDSTQTAGGTRYTASYQVSNGKDRSWTTTYFTSNSTKSASGISSPAAQTTNSAEAAQQNSSNKNHDSPLPIGVIVLIPLAILAMAVVAFLVWRRRRNRLKGERGIPTQQMKVRSRGEGLLGRPPGYSESTSGFLLPPSTTSVGALAVPAPTTASSTRAPAQPVILNTNMESAYFTGLDTSDAVSLTSNPNANRTSVDERSINSDEPPPPYRPASVPPISRETSVRNPNGHLSIDTALASLSARAFGLQMSRVEDDSDEDDDATPTAETPMRNPFEDPEDDAASGTSTPVQRAQDGSLGRFSFEQDRRI